MLTRDAAREDQQSEVANFRSNIGQTYNLMYQQQVQQPQQMMGGPVRQADAVSQNMYQAARINKSRWTKNSSQK